MAYNMAGKSISLINCSLSGDHAAATDLKRCLVFAKFNAKPLLTDSVQSWDVESKRILPRGCSQTCHQEERDLHPPADVRPHESETRALVFERYTETFEFSVALRPQRPYGLLHEALDGHLDFRTAPEL